MEICTNLNNARPGQYVKTGNSKDGARRTAQIEKVYKNGTIVLAGDDKYMPTVDGGSAYPAGRKAGFSIRVSMIWPFGEGETVEGVTEALQAKAAAERSAKEHAAAAFEAETQRKIAAANITHSDSQDIPGARIARWTDRNYYPRWTLYFPKQQSMYGGTGYHCQIADLENGSFGSSFADSMESPEDAVNRWIAAWR